MRLEDMKKDIPETPEFIHTMNPKRSEKTATGHEGG